MKTNAEQLVERLVRSQVSEAIDNDLLDAAKAVGDAVSLLQTTNEPKLYSTEISQLKSIEKSLDAKINKSK